MAIFALTNAFVYGGGHDYTGDTNQVTADMTSNSLNVTVFGDEWTRLIGGLKSVQLDVNGFWQADGADEPDDIAFPALGVADNVYTVGNIGVENEPCYLFRTVQTNYTAFGEIGTAAPFSLSTTGSGAAAARGRLAVAKQTVSATGAVGTGIELAGGIATGEYLYATWHVFPTVGTTITVEVESDSTGAFSTPTTQATIGPVTSVGGSWATRVAGPITDTFFRFNVTAITGTFTAAGAIGLA